jgi:hypothetical protein
MITILPESEGNILGVQASDKLTDPDYRDIWIPKLLELIEKYGNVRALIYLDDTFRGWEVAALFDDAKIGIQHGNEFEKIAVVGGPEWVGWSIKMFAHFMKGEVRVFPGEELKAAWNWIK